MTTFTTITVWRTTLSFRFAFRHNLAERNDAETLIVQLRTADGRVGYGQVLPRSYLTGETLDSALSSIARLWPMLRECEFAGRPVRQVLEPLYVHADAGRETAAYAGLDVAACMALGPTEPGQGFQNRYNGGRLPLVGVVSATGARKAALLVWVLKRLGYRRFKVKVGRDQKKDEERLRAVRRVLGKGDWLIADANAAWDWDEAATRMRRLREAFGVEVVEEPLTASAGKTADYRRLERETGVGTMADESICTRADAQNLLERGSPSWWNLRLAKNGGFSGVRALAELAEAGGVRLYGGILVGETGALAAASRIAYYDAGVECGEYGFSRIFLRADPFRGSPAGYFGAFLPPNEKENTVRAGDCGITGTVVFSESML